MLIQGFKKKLLVLFIGEEIAPEVAPQSDVVVNEVTQKQILVKYLKVCESFYTGFQGYSGKSLVWQQAFHPCHFPN